MRPWLNDKQTAVKLNHTQAQQSVCYPVVKNNIGNTHLWKAQQVALTSFQSCDVSANDLHFRCKNTLLPIWLQC